MQVSRNQQKAISTTYLSIAGNTFIAIIKWVTGLLGNSYGLIADAIESTCDIFSSFLVLFGLKYSSKPADKNHPYGHGKAEFLSAAVWFVWDFSLGVFCNHAVKNAVTTIPTTTPTMPTYDARSVARA